MAGCGLGSLIFKTNGFWQTSAATTNGFFGTQTFGITSGTSNCTSDGLILASKDQEAFFEANLAQLQKDMASGGGEYLAGFVDLMECDDTVKNEIYSSAQAMYDQVFPDANTSAVQALYAFKIGLS